jgi:hypothetical protein
MPHKKTPQCRARLFRGYKSDYKTIANLSQKNNAPGDARLYVISGNDRESIGRHYMSLAVQYGHIELQKGLSLYTSAGIETLGLKTNEGIKAAFPSGAFFFVTENYIFECLDPLHVLDCMEGEKEKAACGKVLPINYMAAKETVSGLL